MIMSDFFLNGFMVIGGILVWMFILLLVGER